MVKISNMPWVDKYRPQKLSQIIQQTEITDTLQKMIESHNLPHMLFYGPSGTGKTSTIYAVALELFGPDKIDERVIELNASDERGISVVRNKITKFAKSSIGSRPLNSKYPCPPLKIIILDEADAMTHEAQSALRKLMEVVKTTRFCFICNYKSQIIEPIESRCACFRFKNIGQNVMKNKLRLIADKEKLNINEDGISLVSKIAEGDTRRAIMILHNIKYLQADKKITCKQIRDITSYIDNLNINFDKLHELSIIEIRKIINNIINKGYSINYVLNCVRNEILNSKNITDKCKSSILIYLAEVEKRLIEGGNEYLQLLSLMIYIKQR